MIARYQQLHNWLTDEPTNGLTTWRIGYLLLGHGYRVVPAYTFGECDTYYNLQPGGQALRERLADKGFPAICVTGPLRWIPFMGLVPFGRGVGLHTVHGEGRQFPKVDQPTKEQVQEYHAW